jgi:hypothetical protein
MAIGWGQKRMKMPKCAMCGKGDGLVEAHPCPTKHYLHRDCFLPWIYEKKVWACPVCDEFLGPECVDPLNNYLFSLGLDAPHKYFQGLNDNGHGHVIPMIVMIISVRDGREKIVKETLLKGEPLFWRPFPAYPKGWEAYYGMYFVEAWKCGNQEMVTFLLENGCDRSGLLNLAKNLIMYDYKNDWLDFIISDCHFDVRSNESECLCIAAENGRLDLLPLLINLGSNVCAQSNRPLWLAAKNGMWEVVQYLIIIGADLFSGNGRCIKEIFRKTTLMMKLIVLEEGVHPNYANGELFVMACRSGEFELYESMMDYGLNPRIRGDAGLKEAAKYGHRRIVEAILKKYSYNLVMMLKAAYMGNKSIRDWLFAKHLFVPKIVNFIDNVD